MVHACHICYATLLEILPPETKGSAFVHELQSNCLYYEYAMPLETKGHLSKKAFCVKEEEKTICTPPGDENLM